MKENPILKKAEKKNAILKKNHFLEWHSKK